MRAVVVYESMFGNTHEVAERIATGLRQRYEVTVLPVGEAIAQILPEVDLLVVGGPTHAHGLSRPATRSSAVRQASENPTLDAEPGAGGPGVRDWLRGMAPDHGTPAAAFDTRVVGPATLTGRAAKAIARRLRRHHFELVADPESFLVDEGHHLIDGEADRATAWGVALAMHRAPAGRSAG